MDGPTETPVVAEHEMSEIPNLNSEEQADPNSEEQVNPDTDVPEQYKEEVNKTFDEEPKDPNNGELGNPNAEEQANMNDRDMGDQHNEDQAIPSPEEPANVDGGEAEAEQQASAENDDKKWPGWPGESVFRVLVPVQKVGAVIGRKGEFIKRMCEESRARIKILDGPPGVPERAVLTAV